MILEKKIRIFIYNKMIEVIMKTHIERLSIFSIAVFAVLTMIYATPALISTNANAQERSEGMVPAATPGFCQFKLLKDSALGNSMGWNPSGSQKVFTIKDPCFLPHDSIVLLNVKDGGSQFYACNVDFMKVGAFEVFCTSGPANGSELHYTILFNVKKILEEEVAPQAEVPDRQPPTNSTQ